MFYIHIINRGEKPSDFPYKQFDFKCDRTALESAQNRNSRRAKAKAAESQGHPTFYRRTRVRVPLELLDLERWLSGSKRPPAKRKRAI
jgi:hypothetical protein